MTKQVDISEIVARRTSSCVTVPSEESHPIYGGENFHAVAVSDFTDVYGEVHFSAGKAYPVDSVGRFVQMRQGSITVGIPVERALQNCVFFEGAFLSLFEKRAVFRLLANFIVSRWKAAGITPPAGIMPDLTAALVKLVCDYQCIQPNDSIASCFDTEIYHEGRIEMRSTLEAAGYAPESFDIDGLTLTVCIERNDTFCWNENVESSGVVTV